MPGTAEQREQAARELKQKNMKDVFELPPELRIIGNPVLIFNVGPFRYQRSMGSYGQWVIHPCEEGQPYSKGTEVPYITNDPVHVDMFQMAHRHDSGRKLAHDIIGVGQFHTPSEDLSQWGVFVAEGATPTDSELREAKRKLMRTADRLIQEADTYWNQGPSEYKNVTEMHRWAARARGQVDKPWARAVQQLLTCDICGSQVAPTAAICPTCRNVIDEERVIKAKLKGFEHLWKTPKKATQELE